MKIFTKKIIIHETEFAYVSPYSYFLCDNMQSIYFGKTICDFGTGTGILSLVSCTYGNFDIILIDKNLKCIDLALKNFAYNHINTKDIKCYKNAEECLCKIDTIICNPASLPNINKKYNSFCDGGELGLDMIFDTIEFAKNALQINGNLYMIVTSILPYSLIENKLDECKFKYDVIASKLIPFRSHYKGINKWVDKLKTQYSEMEYYKNKNRNFEKLMLWKISWR